MVKKSVSTSWSFTGKNPASMAMGGGILFLLIGYFGHNNDALWIGGLLVGVSIFLNVEFIRSKKQQVW